MVQNIFVSMEIILQDYGKIPKPKLEDIKDRNVKISTKSSQRFDPRLTQ